MSIRLASSLVGPQMKLAARRADALACSLSPLGRVDFATGAVSLEESRVMEVLQKFLSPETSARGHEDMVSLARDGFLVLDKASFAAGGGGSSQAAIPWVSLRTMLQENMRFPPSLFNGLGVEPSFTPEQALEALRQRFSSVPPSMSDTRFVTQLIHGAQLAQAGPLTLAARPDTFESRTLVGTGSINPSLKLGFLVLHWWGWEIRLSFEAGRVLYYALLGVESYISINLLLAALGIIAITNPVAGVVAGALWLYLLLILRVLRPKVDRGQGFSLKGNWPTPLLGMFVWVS